MKKSVMALFGAVLSFALLFICVGYAQLTVVLDITGAAEAAPPQGVYIFDVAVPDGTNATVNGFAYCVLNSTVTLGASGTSTATLDITVYNNSDTVYGYNIMRYSGGTDAYDNENIVITPDIERRTEVAPYGYLTFSVEFSYKDNTAASNSVLNSVVQFEFLPLDEIPEDKDETTVTNAMERLGEILNNTTDVDGDGTMDGDELTYAMENPPKTGIFGSNARNTSFISNVPGAPEEDQTALNTLFDGYQKVVIDGVETEVKILIKSENINSSYSGDEMVIYMTTDPLTSAGSSAVVYRCIFVYDSVAGRWVQFGEMVRGTAPVTDYKYGTTWGSGSFNTDRWSAS